MPAKLANANKFIVNEKAFITESDVVAVVNVLKRGWLSLGKEVLDFEKSFASYTGSKYAIAVSSGTAALHLCLKAIGIRRRDEVITSPFSYISSANCILYEQARPVFVDVEEETFNLDPRLVEKAITRRTRAILLVHVFGLPANFSKLKEIALKHKLALIGDACEAVGAEISGRRVGSLEDLAAFSFFPNKQITTGEGGMVTTNNKKFYLLLKELSHQGKSSIKIKSIYSNLGYSYRMDELSAALGLSQLKKINYVLEDRKRIANLYKENLQELHLKKIVLPFESQMFKRSWFVYPIRLLDSNRRNEIIQILSEESIPAKAYFPPIHLQPFYASLFGYRKGDFPICEMLGESIICLPIITGMPDETVIKICDVFKQIIRKIL